MFLKTKFHNFEFTNLSDFIMKKLFILLLIGFLATSAYTQDQAQKPDSAYQFTIVKKLPATSVKNQYRSSTCWSYSAIAFLESELLRMGKDTFDLSEMYCVRKCYDDKAPLYIRFQGKHNFGSGGAAHDVTYVLKNYGLLPESAYTGMTTWRKQARTRRNGRCPYRLC